MTYSLQSFEADIYCAYAPSHSPGERGAYMSAAIKRYKSNRVLEVLLAIEDVDWTPTLANNIITRCWGRSISRPILVDAFGKEGRTAAFKSADIDRQDELIELYKRDIITAITHAEHEIASSLEKIKTLKANQ